MKGCEDKNRDKNITFENSQIKIKKFIGILYEFRNTIESCLDKFFNYAMVLVIKVVLLYLF